MGVCLNDFRELVTLHTFVQKNEGDTPKRSFKKSKTLWASFKVLPLQNAVQAASASEVVDGRIKLSKAYMLYLRLDPGSFDNVTWCGESYRRVSALQKEDVYWRCIVATFEDKEL